MRDNTQNIIDQQEIIEVVDNYEEIIKTGSPHYFRNNFKLIKMDCSSNEELYKWFY